METYITTHSYLGVDYDIYGCSEFNDIEEYDFYDIYNDGICINEGVPFSELPTKKDVIDFIEENNI